MKIPVFSFYTLGCRLNQAEEESMRREVMEKGLLVSVPDKADFCIVNTCSVTAMADKKSKQAIRTLKKQNQKLKIIVTGCGAKEAEGLVEADIFISNTDKDNVLDIVVDKYKISTDDSQLRKRPQLASKYRTRALLKVQDGCNNFCAYCIVPFMRGREVSVSRDLVIKEAKKLDRAGYRELVISGVNVGRYEGEAHTNLVGLIGKILAETEFPRIRLSSVNPQDITDDLIDLWASEPRLARHFHISLQSGSSAVLKRMGRPYTADQCLKIVKKIYKKIPGMAITTDVIVGFPGETEKEFQETIDLVKKAKLAKVHVFRYSNRQGTKASKMTTQIPAEKIKERAASLLRSTKVLEDEYKARFLGQEVEVLFEYQRKGFWYGLTSNYIRVKRESRSDLCNKLKNIRITNDGLA